MPITTFLSLVNKPDTYDFRDLSMMKLCPRAPESRHHKNKKNSLFFCVCFSEELEREILWSRNCVMAASCVGHHCTPRSFVHSTLSRRNNEVHIAAIGHNTAAEQCPQLESTNPCEHVILSHIRYISTLRNVVNSWSYRRIWLAKRYNLSLE